MELTKKPTTGLIQPRETILIDDKLVDEYGLMYKSEASNGRTFVNWDTNISVRSEFAHSDYRYFRQSEQIPEDPKGRIEICMDAYDKVGIIRNVVDLMADFACQGICLCHPNKRIEQFYRNWFEKVNGKERSERFLNTLYRTGNVIIERKNGTVFKRVEKEWKVRAEEENENGNGNGDLEDLDILESPDEVIEKPDVKRRRLPLKYTIHDPLSIEILGEDLLPFMGKPIFALRISTRIISRLSSLSKTADRTPQTMLMKQTVNQMPKRLKLGLGRYNGLVPLDNDNIIAYYYKKDDWESWAKPMVFAVISDVLHLEKIKLADKAALDGVISNIRLWRLGNFEYKVLPSRAAIQKLRNILANNVGGGVLDLVWGPELDFKESNTQTHQFLGKAKYESTWSEIYAGLGIPPTLTGSATASGFTNNYISIKTLIERLEYGRTLLTSFWRDEIKRVQTAMKFRLPATVVFGQGILSDESAEKALLVQLIDRDIISSEAVQAAFGFIPEIENIKMNRERKLRGKRLPDKASPYHNPQTKHDLDKILLQGGNVAPSEIGIELLPKTPGEKTKLEMMGDLQDKKFKPVGSPLDGRPKNAKDKEKRKQKVVKPRVSAFENFLWAVQAQQEIDKIVNPAYLKLKEKKNLRQLIGEESEELESMKFGVLCNLKPFIKINSEKVYELLKETVFIDEEIHNLTDNLITRFQNRYSCKPIFDEVRQIRASAYALFLEGETDGDT